MTTRNPDASVNVLNWEEVTLPPGAATETTLNAVLGAVDALESLTAAIRDRLPALLAGDGGIKASVLNFPASVEVSNDVGSPLPVNGAVVANQGTPAVVANAWPARDDYQTGETLADQSGAGAVLTFTFAAAVQLVVAHSVGANLVSRVDPFGGAPSATLGFRCDDGVPTYLPVTTSSVRVFAPSGTTVTINGFRRG